MNIENKINEILIYDNNVEIEFSADDKTFWLDAHHIAKLFDRDRTVIVRHINNIYKTKELSQNSTCAKNAQVAKDGKTREMNHYNLDVIIAVGYRVNSSKGTKFRIWATKHLKEVA